MKLISAALVFLYTRAVLVVC